MPALLASAAIEWKRLTRTNSLAGLIIVFIFFGVSGPILATLLPEIMAAASGSEQLTIVAEDPVPLDGILMFNQSAMQVGLIVAAITTMMANAWDGKPGLSIFYRLRGPRLSTTVVPRIVVASLASLGAYCVGFVVAYFTTVSMMGDVSSVTALTIWAASSVYLVFAGALGFLIMVLARSTVAATAGTIIALLFLPFLGQISAIQSWSPFTLLAAAQIEFSDLLLPTAVTLLVTVGIVVLGLCLMRRQTLKRDA